MTDPKTPPAPPPAPAPKAKTLADLLAETTNQAERCRLLLEDARASGAKPKRLSRLEAQLEEALHRQGQKKTPKHSMPLRAHLIAADIEKKAEHGPAPIFVSVSGHQVEAFLDERDGRYYLEPKAGRVPAGLQPGACVEPSKDELESWGPEAAKEKFFRSVGIFSTSRRVTVAKA